MITLYYMLRNLFWTVYVTAELKTMKV